MTSIIKGHVIHRTTLDNGVVVMVVENSTSDIVAARLFLRAGSRWEPREKSGLAHLLASVLTKGTERFSSQEIAEQVEFVGASLGTDVATDYFLLGTKTVSADFADILTLAGEILRSPTFPEDQVELERRLTLQALRSRIEQPFTIAADQLRQTLYGAHPYALPTLGTPETVAQLQRSDLQHFHQTYFRPDNLVISIVGRVVPDEAVELVEQIFGNWSVPPEPLPTLVLPMPESHPQTLVTAQDTQQTIVILGYLAPAASAFPPNADAYSALKLMSTYLGNGLSSRLFVELREKRGLAYDVSAFYPTHLDKSQFSVYLGTAPDNTAIAQAGLQQECDRLRDVPLTPEELQTAKNKLLGQYALGKQTSSQIAQVLGWYEILGLGIEFDAQFQQNITAVTIEQIQKVAGHYLTQPYISLVGPADAVNIRAADQAS